MEASYITSRRHQLRLQGNVQLSSFKRNVQDSFQTTIGGKYPYYSRASQMNYRSFTLNGVVSINFDPTSAFMRLDAVGKIALFDILSNNRYSVLTKYSPGLTRFFKKYGTDAQGNVLWQFIGPSVDDHMDIDSCVILVNHCSAALSLNGLWWDDDSTGNSQLILQDRDIFETQQVSLSRKRIPADSKDPFGPASIQAIDAQNKDLYLDGTSIYDAYLHRQSGLAYGTIATDEMVFVERKFRDQVMSWLSDGKPKLFRSETEGNMIVMVSGVSFTPLDKTNRMVYSVSMTVTEIDEFSGENLLLYNLVPCDIRSIYMDPDIYGYTWGDYDPNVDSSLKYYYSDDFAIPDLKLGDASMVVKIPTESGVVGGKPPYTFSAEGLPRGLSIQSQTTEIDGETILGGTIIGYPTGNTPMSPSYCVLTVRDANGDSASIQVPYGYMYRGLDNKRNPDDSVIPILIVNREVDDKGNPKPIKVGDQIKPEVITDYFVGGVAPFKITGEGLPSGVAVNSQSKTLYGAYGAAIEDGTGQIVVIDSLSQRISIPVIYGAGVYGLSFVKYPEFDYDYTERTVEIPRVDVTIGVSGGIGDKENFTYKCSSIIYPLPEGWQISNGNSVDADGNVVPKGTIFGIPTKAQGSGQFEVTVVDEAENQKSILINYNQILEQFVYKPNVLFYIDIPPATLGTYPQDIQLGTVIAPKETISGVSGGLPFTADSPYRFEATGLLPNFQINNKGVISGVAQVAIPKHEATLYAIDARGHRAECKILIGNISSTLSYKISGYLIKGLHVGKPIERKNVFDITGGQMELRILDPEGGTPIPVPPNYKCVAMNFPKGLGIEYIFNETSKNGGWYFTGTPLEAQAGTSDGWLLFTDNLGNRIQIQVRFNTIYSTLVWSGDRRVVISGQPGEEFKYKVTGLAGGQPPYTINFSAGVNVKVEFGVTDDITSLYLVGTLPNELNKEIPFEVTVSDGTDTVKGQFALKTTQPPLKITKIKDFSGILMLVNHAKVKNEKVMEISGGNGNYEIMIGTGGTSILGGLQFSIIQENGSSYVVVNGTPEQLTDTVDFSSLFNIQDTGGHKGSISFSWYGPKVVNQPSIARSIGGTQTDLTKDYTEGSIIFNQPWSSVPYFEYLNVPGVTVTVSGGGLPEVVKGNIVNGSYSLSGIITDREGAAKDTVFTLSIPKVSDYDEAFEKKVNVKFSAVLTTMTYTKSPVELSIPGLGIRKKMDKIIVSKGLNGGRGDFEWKAEGLPTGLTITWDPNNTREAWIEGTPTVEHSGGTIKVTVIDKGNNNTSKSINIAFGGVYPPITVNGSITVPEMKGDTDLAAISLTGKATGGSGKLKYVDKDQLLASSGYYIDEDPVTGSYNIKGHSTIASQPEKTGFIYVIDDKKQEEKIAITIKKIVGELSFSDKVTTGGPFSLPTKKINTTLSANERPKLYNGAMGGTAPYKFEESPSGGWKDYGFTITMNQQGEMTTVKYPSVETPAGSFNVRLTDATGANIVFKVNFGKVTK